MRRFGYFLVCLAVIGCGASSPPGMVADGPQRHREMAREIPPEAPAQAPMEADVPPIPQDPGARADETPRVETARTEIDCDTPGLPLDKESIRCRIRQKLPDVAHCYELALDIPRTVFSCTVITEFMIDHRGQVHDAHTSGCTDVVTTCVNAVVQTIQFPTHADPGPVKVRYPFTFRPVRDAPVESIEATPTAEQMGDAYLHALAVDVFESWDQPENGIGTAIGCVHLGVDGRVRATRLLQPSQNDDLDNSTMLALKKLQASRESGEEPLPRRLMHVAIEWTCFKFSMPLPNP